MTFKNKYLKYKKKYLDLKNQFGGMQSSQSVPNMQLSARELFDNSLKLEHLLIVIGADYDKDDYRRWSKVDTDLEGLDLQIKFNGSYTAIGHMNEGLGDILNNNTNWNGKSYKEEDKMKEMKDYWNNLFNYIKQKNSNENILIESTDVIIDRGTLGHMTDYDKVSGIGTFYILLNVLKDNHVPYIWLPNTAFSTDSEVVKNMLFTINDNDEKEKRANEVIANNNKVIKRLGKHPYFLQKIDEFTIKLGDDTWNFWGFFNGIKV